MGSVKQQFDFTVFKQISGKCFLYSHTLQIYHHNANSAFHLEIGEILKCNNFDLRILNCVLSNFEFHQLKSHFELHRDWQIYQTTAKWLVLFYPVPQHSGKSPRGYLKIQGAILNCTSWLLLRTLSAGYFLLLISLLTFMSIYVQSLEL